MRNPKQLFTFLFVSIGLMVTMAIIDHKNQKELVEYKQKVFNLESLVGFQKEKIIELNEQLMQKTELSIELKRILQDVEISRLDELWNEKETKQKEEGK